MSKELVIGSNRHETKVAILEEDQLVEVYFQRANEYSLAGSIHKGRVTRVLPGMQSAFVDLGLERDTFLYVSDFFEENEDIDTVAEEKPGRVDRKDRGRTRNPERVFEEPKEEVEEARPFLAEPTAQEAEVAEDEPGTPLAEAANPAEAGESRPAERNDADKNFRGDRRNRRSRRRRQRGRGFPENKYAPPSGTPSESSGPVIARPVEQDNVRDVIVLPGESLAKYRNMASGAEISASADEREPADEADPTIGDPGVERDDDIMGSEPDPEIEQEAIESEAEELELSDKIFSHHDDPSPAAIEEKIEEVKQDQPAPPANSSETGEAASSSEQFDAAGWQAGEVSEPESPDTNVLPFPEPPEGEALDAEEFEILGPEERPSEETPGPRVVGMGEVKEPASAPEAQTASLRDQSGRYMHRASRRMRRRRGGNRFGQAPELGTVSSGGGAGAAPALEPDAAAHSGGGALDRKAGTRDAFYFGSPETGTGDHCANCQRAVRAKGRAHHIAYCAAWTVRGLHAERYAFGSFAEDRER